MTDVIHDGVTYEHMTYGTGRAYINDKGIVREATPEEMQSINAMYLEELMRSFEIP